MQTLRNQRPLFRNLSHLYYSSFIIRRITQGIHFLSNILAFVKFYKNINDSGSAEIIAHNQFIPYKWTSRYLALFFSTKERMIIIENHYKYINTHLTTECISLLRDGITLWSKVNSSDTVTIVLTVPSSEFMLEGELALVYYFNSLSLFKIHFTIVQGKMFNLHTEQVIFIGGSQGRGGASSQMRYAAKTNSEIHPPTMLVIALQSIGVALKISTIVGISSHAQVSETVHTRYQSHLSTYDNLWEANGGEWRNHFYFLSSIPHVKPITLVTRCHRSRANKKRKIKNLIMTDIIDDFASYI